jgi:hypothetical protein
MWGPGGRESDQIDSDESGKAVRFRMYAQSLLVTEVMVHGS